MRLSGKAAICQFMGRGWGVVEELVLNEGFPAKKILGLWESDSELITQWRLALLEKQKSRRGNPNFIKNSSISRRNGKKRAKKANDIHN